MTLGDSVEWLGHPSVYLVIDESDTSVQLRQRARSTSYMPWVSKLDVRVLTEDQAVERLIAEGRSR